MLWALLESEIMFSEKLVKVENIMLCLLLAGKYRKPNKFIIKITVDW